MARKIKFALEMKNGVKVRSNLEELRENFDLEKAVGHFLSGKLIEWLEDRYYEDEAKKLSALDKDSADFRGQLCAILGVEYDGGDELDVATLERLNEKKIFLRQKTDDKSIIDNAARTALNQEDLSYLLDMDEPTIYLCDESFNIPIRIENKKYIGILGTPKISINANSQADLDAKNISFENCILPFDVKNETSAKISIEKSTPKISSGKHKPYLPKKRLIKMLRKIGDSTSLIGRDKVWNFVFDKKDKKIQKKIAIQKIFNGEYSEDDLIYVSLDKIYGSNKIPGFSGGWGVTVDSFCHGSVEGTNEIIKYADIKSADSVKLDRDIIYTLVIETQDGQKHTCKECRGSESYYDVAFLTRFLKEIQETRKYLEMTNDLKEKSFEDVVSKEELEEIFQTVFNPRHDENENSIWEYYNLFGKSEELSPENKQTALKFICDGKYTEKDLIHIAINYDFTAGWAFTKDSVCFAGELGKIIVPYEDIEVFKNNLELDTPYNNDSIFSFDTSKKYVYSFQWGEKNYRNYKEIAQAKENFGLKVFGNNLDDINEYLKMVGELFMKSQER